ncbi:hypothetical protein [Feifania hominis]|uniref:Uncharacterized protein n=1 Tax=Feifania hominis TaxID=2763660 RepID=A0A926DER7_9FIRM|nr:hypothetical protein [Feifania hominis]MBC8536502.1 hypothetical protein [Feifania hominis]
MDENKNTVPAEEQAGNPAPQETAAPAQEPVKAQAEAPQAETVPQETVPQEAVPQEAVPQNAVPQAPPQAPTAVMDPPAASGASETGTAQQETVPQETVPQNAVPQAPSQAPTAVMDPPAASGASETGAVQQETVQQEAVLQNAVPQAPQAPLKKKNKGLIITIAVLAAALIALITAVATGVLPVFGNGHLAYIESAFEATAAQKKDVHAAFRESNPEYAAWADYKSGDFSETTFDLTLRSIDGFDGAQELSSLLAGTGISGTTATDVTTHSVEFDATLLFSHTPLLELYGHFEPELAALGIPSMSDTIFSVNPKTMYDDVEGSVFSQLFGITADDLRGMFGELDGSADPAEMDIESMEKMGEEFAEIFKGALAEAKITKGDTTAGLTAYTLTFTSETIKKYTTESVKYLFLDSPLAAVYRTTFAAQAAQSGMSYDQFIQQELLGALEEENFNIQGELTLGIDKEKIIREMVMVLTPKLAAKEGGSFDEFRLTGVNEQDETTFTASFTMHDDYNETLEMALTFSEIAADDTYNIYMCFDVAAYEIAGEFSFDFVLGADGTISTELAVTADEGYGENGFVLSSDAVCALKTGGRTLAFDRLDLDILDEGEKINIHLDGTFDTNEYTSSQLQNRPTSDLFDMTEKDFVDVVTEMEDGANELQQVFYGVLFTLMYGAMPY